MAKFTVYTDKHNEFRWKFTASNNVVVAKSGESYLKQEDCLASLGLLQKDIGGAPVGYQLRKGTIAPAPAHAPGVLIAPSTAAHPAGTVHPSASATPAASSSAPVSAPPTPTIPPSTAERFVSPANPTSPTA